MSKVFKLSGHIIVERDDLSGECVLVDGHNGSMWACNPTAGAIMDALENGATLELLTDRLCERFGTQRGPTRDDVQRFVDAMCAIAVLAVVDEESTHAIDREGRGAACLVEPTR